MWQRLKGLRSKIPEGRVKFKIGDLVRIAKEKLKFAKGYEQNYSTEIFYAVKFINRKPQPVYELTDLNNRPIEEQFYNYELVKVTVSPETEFQIEKFYALVRTRAVNSILSNGKVMTRLSIRG